MICAPSSRSCAGVIPLTVPCVATGMNVGVSTTPCAVGQPAARARAVGVRGHSNGAGAAAAASRAALAPARAHWISMASP